MGKERDVLVTFNFPFTREEYLPGKLMGKFPIVSPWPKLGHIGKHLASREAGEVSE